MLSIKVEIVNQEVEQNFISFLKENGIKHTVKHHTDLGYDTFEWETVTIHDPIYLDNRRWCDEQIRFEYTIYFQTGDGEDIYLVIDQDCKIIKIM